MNFIATLRALSLPRQMMLAATVLGVIGAMYFMMQGVMEKPKALLYSGLDASHTGEIIEELEKRNTPYEIRGDAIFVAESDRDSVRFALAKDGLPRQSVQGYELLDDVNGFSMTSEMYNASYWRAKEGELTRTILAVPGVQSVRVHIGASLRSGFARSEPAQTASVTLSTAYDLSSNQAEAIQYMVALAVSGLNPDEVAVIDMSKGILAGPGIEKADMPGAKAESQEAALEQKIISLLEARVGLGNARVSVSMDVSHERQKTSAVSFDPDSRVVRTRSSGDTSESSGGSTGALTGASNLPQAATPGGSSNSTTKNSNETVSYEINETRTEVEKLPGEIERISIAVLLNDQGLGIDPAAADAATLREQVAANIKQLIISGAGLDTSRGDNLTVEFMPFQLPVAEGLVTAPSMVDQLVDRYMWSGIKILVLGLVVIVLALGVIRPMLRPAPAVEDELVPAGGDAPAIASDPFASLQDYTRERQAETAAILQEWLDADREQQAAGTDMSWLNDDRKAAVNE